ncbi:uncharacterized protein LOC105390473 isoform X1 [Plutella xylostella]|uniref:uncharacterized protein LOC105390473 isoform X1 n=1 Tax=Plutella xylostella TaxID=51655 RepID=UPI0020323449|nr:uncharacterized protein LOC105390473 isoform X1 [Plutella xylostella]XP_048477516.1 uncharacterized protein LOC105390473 isoform X1 [Plutella xylostella]
MLPTSVVVTSIKCLLLLTTATVYGQDINYLSTFKDYLNSQVNQPYVYEDALLLNQQDSGDNVIIEVNFKVSEKSNPKSFKLLKCTATIASDQDGGLSLPEGHHCQEDLAVARYNVTDNVDGQDQAEEASTEVIHEILVELDNEVQSDTAVTSGEQFVAVPRQSPEAPCIGCSSIVNTSAAGVTDLARLAVADLNRHVTNATHTLDQVLRVERQVQVNGVRYIMTLAVDYIDTNQESGSKTCKISILEKPWVKRLDGSKYRAVLSNNCTEEWIYDVNNDNNNDEDNIKAIHTVEAQAAPSTERTLTDEELKLLEDQIIPNTQDKLQENVPTTTETQTSATEKVQNVFEVNSSPDLYNKEETGENREPVLTKEKQEVIDGLMNFFDDRDDLVNLEKNLLRRQTLQKRDVANENINSVDKVQSHPKIKFVGAPATVDPSDPKYRVIAEKSLKKYTADTGLGSEYSVLSVERASTQLVAGTLTRVDFTAGARDQPVRCHSVLYERPWENFEQLNVTCDFHNLKKREMPGAPQALNVSDPKYHALAVEALAKYTLDSGDPTPYQVVSVLSGTKQVVAGSSTRLVFAVRAAPAGPATATCEAVVWEQPWRKFKEINVTCNLKNRQKREAPNDQESVEKHQTIVRNHPEINFVGAPATVDPSDPKYRVIAEKSLKKYTADTGLGSEYSVLSVERASTQLVAGTLTRVDFTAGARDQPVRCHSVLYERPWENFEQLNVTCDFHNLKKRGMLGAPEALNVSDPKYHALAVEALAKYTLDSGDPTPYQVVSVLSGSEQVVAGSSTRLVFAVRAAPTGPATATCEAVVWEQPWRKFKEIKVTCNLENRQKRESPSVQESVEKHQTIVRSHPEINFVGAPATVDASDPKYRVIAEKSLKKYTADTGLGSEYSVLSVEHATTQLVAGTLTTVDFTAGARDQPVRCHSVLYERPWENFEQLNVTCDFHNLKKRGMPGAPEALNVSDPKYHALAVEALGKYTMDSGDTTPYQVVSVLSGTKQVVAGSSTRLVFAVRAAPTGPATATCEAVVWEQPWRKFKEINVTCNLNNRQKRETPNALPADEQILVQEAIERYQQLSNTKYAYRVMKVLNVTRQSPEGLITKMEFEVSPTKCKVTDDIATIRACELRHTHAKLLCLTTVHQNSPTDQKTFDIICEEKQKKHKHPIDNDENVQQLIQEAIDKLESNQLHTNKQRLLQIHKHYTNVTSTKVTTIDFDLAYTSCLKYEIIEDVENCKFIDSIPPRHCVASVYERHWMTNGKYIDVNCDNDEQAVAGETIDSNVTMALANEALKHVEAKYPHPNKQIVVKIISAERQVVAGVHWRLKMEVGLSTCPALTPRANCRRDSDAPTKFCRANIWVQPSGDHPPIYRVSCEDQDEATTEMYEKLQAQKLFADFVGTYRPTYALDRIELGRRFEIFRENVKKMHELNTHERGTATYGVTRFADLTREEFTKRHLGLKPELKDHNQIPRAMASIPQVELPAGFDWREKGAVTEVKNQGACGSCWAFSVTGNVEGQYQLKTGKLLSLSEQELVDCDKLDNGCNGGLPDNAYRAIEQLGGLEVESDYPYDGADDKCSFNKTLSRVQISGAVNISSDETDMAKWLVQHGPISIGINANAMQFYVGGVSHPWKMLCNPKNIDHGVLIVGYGVKQYPLFKRTMPYWIVKNSWGPLWGEQGYYRVYRGDGTCGVNQMASSALI